MPVGTAREIAPIIGKKGCAAGQITGDVNRDTLRVVWVGCATKREAVPDTMGYSHLPVNAQPVREFQIFADY